MFSQACQYAIRAMIYIASQSQEGNRVSLRNVAEAIGSPTAFTSKILQTMVKDDLIISYKGAGGGFKIPYEKLYQLTLLDIVTSIDGQKLISKCGIGLKECSERKPCPVHNQYKIIKRDLTHMLRSTTIVALAAEMTSGLAFLKL